MDISLAELIKRLLTTKNRELFIVKLGVSLILKKLAISTIFHGPIGFFFGSVLGVLIELGVFKIDLALDSLREGKKLEEFEREATALYEKVTAKIYDEEKKNEIRKQYLDVISRIGVVGVRRESGDERSDMY